MGRTYSRFLVFRPAVLRWAGPPLAVLFLFLLYDLVQSFAMRVDYDFRDEAVLETWELVGGIESARGTHDGLAIAVDSLAFLLSPREGSQEPGLDQLHWSQVPYIKIELAPVSSDRTFSLVWLHDPGSGKAYELPFTVPAMAASIVIDTQHNQPWTDRSAWDRGFPDRGRINHFGLMLHGDTTVRRISLLSLPGPLDLARLAWRQYWTVEPVKVSSINFQYGLEILGVPLSAALGGISDSPGSIALTRVALTALRGVCAGATTVVGRSN